MVKVICIGSSSQDIFFPTKEGTKLETPDDLTSKKKLAFELGSKYHINDRFETLGGTAVNQAAGLAKLGVAVACYTVLGNDMTGQWIRERIEKTGINSSLITFRDSLSGLSAIIVDEESGERIIFSNQEANEKMEIHPEKFSDAEWISVSDPSGNWQEVMDQVLEIVKQNNSKLAFNPRGKNIQENPQKVFELAGKCEIFFVNKDEAIEIISALDKKENLDSEEYLLKELKNSGAKVVVITDGERGAWADDGKGVQHVGAIKIKAVDSTGAGDAFASGFLAGHIKEKSIKECLISGVVNGR